MKISVIIITRNRLNDVRMVIKAFENQAYPDKEIIVVDNESRDGTREMMTEEFPHLKYLWLPDNIDIKAINIGIEMSDGDIIWRTDSDSHPESGNEFEKTVEIFNKFPDIDIIATEDIEVKNEGKPWAWYPYEVDKINVPEDGYKSHYFHGTGAAIRRKVYDKIGGFWEYGMEEIDFSTRAIRNGFKIRFFPNIRVLHHSSPMEKYKDFAWINITKQMIRYNWKVFPFFRALGRTTVVFWMQLILGILSRLSPLVLLEGIMQMHTTTIHTIRVERDVIPKSLLNDITLGRSIFHNYITYFRSTLTGKIKRMFRR